MKSGNAIRALGQSGGGRLPAGLVLDVDVVVVGLRVVVDKQQLALLVEYFARWCGLRKARALVNGSSADATPGGHATPHQRSILPADPAAARSDRMS